MSPDRIGYVVKRYPRFSETFIVSEILAREAAGTDIDIFSLRATVDGRFHDSLSRVRASVSYLSRVSKAEELWTSMRDAAQVLPGLPLALAELLDTEAELAAQSVQLAVEVKRRGIGHLHAHFASSATTVARLAALLAEVPYSFTAHAKDIFHESVDDGDLRRKLADAHHVVTVSDFNVDHLVTRFGADAAKVRRVYNGLDLADFPYAATGTAQSPVILAVGRLVEKKGFDVLLDSCARLASAGRQFRCRIVGTGTVEPELRAQVARLGLDDVVELTGPMSQAEVRYAMRSARLLAVPCVVGSDGNQDGLPTVLLEAMALGTPCVSTDVTGIAEAVQDEHTGLLVPPRDVPALTAAIGRLFDDDALCRRLTSAARGLVEEHFDSRRQARELDALLPRTTSLTEVA